MSTMRRSSLLKSRRAIPLDKTAWSLINRRTRTVRVGGCKPFFSKILDRLSKQTEGHLVRVESGYRLTDRLFQLFLYHLQAPDFLSTFRGTDAVIKDPADRVARALCDAWLLRDWIVTTFSPDWAEIWPRGRPESEAWAELSVVNLTGAHSQFLETDGTGWRLSNGPLGSKSRVEVSLRFANDKTVLPGLTILIRGAAVKSLIEAQLTHGFDTEIAGKARALLTACLREVEEWLCIAQKRGKPAKGRGGLAAFQHDFLGQSWQQTAHSVLKIARRATAAEISNIKQQARQFYKSLDAASGKVGAPSQGVK